MRRVALPPAAVCAGVSPRSPQFCPAMRSVGDTAVKRNKYLRLIVHLTKPHLEPQAAGMERITGDLSVRRLLDFCSLDFEPACLEFYRTERSVRTASSEQVRQPMQKPLRT